MRHILIISCLCELCVANLKLCPQPEDKLSKKEVLDEASICLTNEAGYSKPFPLNLTLDVYFKNVIKIDEDANSISIQAKLLTSWNDPGVNLNHG